MKATSNVLILPPAGVYLAQARDVIAGVGARVDGPFQALVLEVMAQGHGAGSRAHPEVLQDSQGFQENLRCFCAPSEPAMPGASSSYTADP